MKVRPPRFINITFGLVSAFLFVLGFLFIFQQIPPNSWLGMAPEEEFYNEDIWYDLNTLVGWLCVFIAASLAVFLLFMRNKNRSTVASLVQILIVLATAIVFSSIIFEFMNHLLNIKQ